MSIRFPVNYKEILRSGFPTLEFLFMTADDIKALEKLYKLPRTGNVYLLFRNYAKNYYTLNCENVNSLYRCLELASEDGQKEVVEHII